ncbi:MAG: Trehalose 6-phosphate synthase [Clostridia bacterium 62_21]|nr:MAG: Trehalose 6-phosphate synthase [Clostridia bacterium 62_21]
MKEWAASRWMPRKLILVSNRGPYTVKNVNGRRQVERAVGGLVTALEPAARSLPTVWVAWAGSPCGETSCSPDEVSEFAWEQVTLTQEEVDKYYGGFANQALWPLCHYFIDKCRFDRSHWDAYTWVNKKFALQAFRHTTGNSLIWVHDYQLALVPHYLRSYGAANIGFFWHIPFPPPDVLGILPWGREVLRGLLGSDVIGFHVQQYVDNFLRCAETLLNLNVDYDRGVVQYHGRSIRVVALPVGIDASTYAALGKRSDTLEAAAAIRQKVGTGMVALAVDRLDYSKGILERIEALARFWARYESYRGRLSLIQIAAPTRSAVPAYRDLRRQVEEAVGRINGLFGREDWVPVYYYYRSFPQHELAAYYTAADAALVTPLRDGLNLVAKEYVATRQNDGVLVLSRFAGVVEELREAVVVNPYDADGFGTKLKAALEMPAAERRRRMQILAERVKQRDLEWWLGSFITLLAGKETGEVLVKRIGKSKRAVAKLSGELLEEAARA